MLAMMLPMVAMAEVPGMDNLSKKWSDTEGITVMNLEGAMLQAMISSQLDDEEDAAYANEAMNYLKGLKIFACEKRALIGKFTKDVDKMLKKADLQKLVDIDDKDERVAIYTSAEGDITTDIVVYVRESDEVALVCVSGDFTAEIMQGVLGQLGNLTDM